MITGGLQGLYQEYTGVPTENITELPSPGSNRRCFRLTDTKILVGVRGMSVEENNAFLYMATHFRKSGLPVPKVHIASGNKSYHLQEGSRDILLFHAIEKGCVTSTFSEEEKELLRRTIRLPPAVQSTGVGGSDFSRCYPQPESNRHSILRDLNYFKYCFPEATGIEFQEDKLEDDFRKMSDVLLRGSPAAFMYCGFQSRSVMIKNGEPWSIDFQDGRKGSFYYDVASFPWQTKAKYFGSLRRELLKGYIDALRKYQSIDEPYFYSQLRHFVLFRVLRALGAYGFRGHFGKKPRFIQSVPFAIQNLRDLLKEVYPEHLYLCNMLREFIKLKQLTDDLKRRQLTVKVTSFAYGKGIPGDPTGNGGGYVFDYRVVSSPGKCERYEPFTGLDEPVISFLEEDGEILHPLDSVYALVDASVKQYMERGLSNLSVCFGCTGGQHRPVCSAQHPAGHSNRKFGVKVELVHREQNIEHTFEATV